MKKILIMLLAALMVFSFIGCSEKTPEVSLDDVEYNGPLAEDDDSYADIVYEAVENIMAAHPQIAMGIMQADGRDIEYAEVIRLNCYIILNSTPGEEFEEMDKTLKEFAELTLSSVAPFLESGYVSGSISEADDENYMKLSTQANEKYQEIRVMFLELSSEYGSSDQHAGSDSEGGIDDGDDEGEEDEE